MSRGTREETKQTKKNLITVNVKEVNGQPVKKEKLVIWPKQKKKKRKIFQ